MQHSVTLHERAAAGILAGETHRGAFDEQRTEGEKLAEGPVDLAAAAHLETLGEQLLQLGVHGEAGGLIVERVTDQGDDVL